MKCEKHNYGYDDLLKDDLDRPLEHCGECWAIYALYKSNGEICPANIDQLIDVFEWCLLTN